MRRKLRYLLGIILLIAGLLAGCQTVQEPAQTGTAESRTETGENAEVKEPSGEAAEKPAGEAKEKPEEETSEEPAEEDSLPESGEYTSREDVSAYLNTYGHLPENFITKKEAKALGWVSKKGNLEEVAPGKSIGGDHFGNYEGSLPEKKGRTYYECDIDADGGYRGAKRIIYSNDGLIYYTDDHYETFELLYGEE